MLGCVDAQATPHCQRGSLHSERRLALVELLTQSSYDQKKQGSNSTHVFEGLKRKL